uniref:Queuosine 5'-phosphate N-glycosylase/hydrolase n=1 Tax=Phallusia mammillata TaxID=59560 RepID=A0A6F9D611_9ASCI|nr:UPF0553 protein C9orf64 homolog [Phallusia mammillata]
MPEKTEGIDVDDIILPWKCGKVIAESSEHVKINSSSVKSTALKIADCFFRQEYSLKNWKEHTLHPKVANEDAINFIFVIDTLNFSFWSDDPELKFEVKYDGRTYTGYWSMVAALRRAFDEGKPVFSASYMATVSEEEFQDIFRSNSKATVPLIAERYKAYRDAGKVLVDKFEGSFVNCIRNCNADAIALINLVTQHFSSYQDVTEFEGMKFAFYKRAQILVADVWCCFEGKGLGKFDNIAALTMFADYRVPQTLVYFGILEYSKQLRDTLESLEVLKSGCRYEVEIRGCSIAAVQQLVKEIQAVILHSDVRNKEELSKIVNSITVDNYLWDFARANLAKVEELPFHRIRTIYY